MENANLPVIIGVGQYTEPVPEDLTKASSHVDIAAAALERALADTGVEELAAQVDTVVGVRTFADSSRAWPCPFGGANNFPRAVAARTGADPSRAVYASVGGQTPQALVGEFAEALHENEASLVAIFGGEAMANIAALLKHQVKADWSEEVPGDIEDRGLTGDRPLVSPPEIKMGLYQPVLLYAIMEEARRASLGETQAPYRQRMGELFAKFSDVAAENPHAMFKNRFTPEELITPSRQNRPINSTYTKNLVAKDGVNQGAALLLTTAGKARELGISEDKWVYVHASASATDKVLLERQHLGESSAMRESLLGALDDAGLNSSQIRHFDIYSCFPIVVAEAAAILEIADNDRRTLTQTGGLPYFGGPGNNYTMHGIASLVETLRGDPGSIGLAYGNGGWMSKHATGIYATTPPSAWTAPGNVAQEAVDQIPASTTNDAPNGTAVVESFVVEMGREGAQRTLVVVKLADSGERAYALSEPGNDDAISRGLTTDLIGETVEVWSNDDGSWFRF